MEKELATLNLARLSNETHVQFHENIISLIEATASEVFGIDKLYDLYSQAFGNESAALDIVRKNEISVQIAEQDIARDNIFRGFSDTVKGYRNHFDAAMRAAANKLWSIFLHFGNVNIKPLDAQTAAINDMLREFETPELAAALNLLGLKDRSEKLQLENDNFHRLMMDRYNDATNKTVYRMKTVRMEIDKYYRTIVAHINNQLLAGEDDTVFNNFVIEFNAIIKRFKDLLAQKFGRQRAES